MVCLKENIQWKKYLIQKGYWKGCVIARSEKQDKNYCQIQVWKHFMHVLNILFRGTKYCPQKGLCSNTLKSNELKMAHFRYTIWFMISKKSITRCTFLRRSTRMHQKFWKGIQKNGVPQFPMLSALKLPVCRLVFFIYMTTYILT